MSKKRLRLLSYTLCQEDGAYVAQCIEVDVASDGDSEAEAVANLEEALMLYGESENWAPLLMPHGPIELTEEDRAWLNDTPVGREIL